VLSKQEQSRYQKQTILPEIGLAGQEKLCAARVLVIGAGGLGCPVLQYLAAAGVGTLGVADGDVVDLSNLQRQVLYTVNDIGQRKADVAEHKLRALNPHIDIITYPCYIDSGNVAGTIRDYDIIVDGSDNFATRYLVNDACVMQNKPMVSGAIYKFEGQVSVFNYKDGPTYRCIFPEPPQEGESPNCADIGVIATLPGIIGSIQANEVIKIITGVGEVLSGKLLVIDTLTMQSHTFHFKLNAANKKITRLPDSPQPCKVAVPTINYAELQNKMNNKAVQLVDVREAGEHQIRNIGGVNIPLSGLEAGSSMLHPEITTVLYCASGVRSRNAGELLLQKGFKEVFTLEHGINAVQPI
jgi:molybdopterin/thiamine biosynthesis adenylyltransferase/rhodanese-related sulfurtransferase